MKAAAIGLLFVVLALGAHAQTADDPLVAQRRVAMVLRQVNDLYEAGEYQAAADRLGSLSPQAAEEPAALNMRGAIYTKLERYREARQIFLNILESDPNFFPAYFNLGEVQFIQGDYPGALETFRAVARREPRNELVRFKILVCLVQLGNDDEARNLAASFIPAGSTPAWYYAQAVLARQAGDQRLADKHLRAARTIYSPSACKLFDETIQSVKS
jgi:tetratricopeptide (TPR) repeat protein